MSVEHHQLSSITSLFEIFMDSGSINEFGENGLPILSRIMGSPWAFICHSGSRHAVPLLFCFGLQPEAAKNLLGQISQDARQATASLALPDGTTTNVHLYKLAGNNGCSSTLGVSATEENNSLSSGLKEQILNLLAKKINHLIDKEESQKELLHLRVYQSISSVLSQTVDLNEMLELALYSCMELVSAETASVLILDDEKKNFSFYQVEGPSKPLLSGITFPSDSGIAGAALKSRQSEVINDVENDPRFFKNIDSETGFRTRNMIVIPLLAGEQPVGVMEVINKAEDKLFTENERLLLSSIAEEIAFAIRNARIFDYVVGTYCKQKQGQTSCKGCKRPLGSWTPCVKYQGS